MSSFWLILLAPLLSAVAIALTPWRRSIVPLGLCGSLFPLARGVQILAAVPEWPAPVAPWHWWTLPEGPSITFGFQLDTASVLMLLIVGFVGALVQLFSAEYMREEAGFRRYFALVSFFLFAMLGIVFSTNLVQMYVFWELVGFASYLLIGFWFERPAAGRAALKAMLMNRVGDFLFLTGILLAGTLGGALDFETLGRDWSELGNLKGIGAFAGILIFFGAVGKSAQLPLHTWLPTAMEGPTPASALIHAATMVAAGVYLLFRTQFLWAGPAGDFVAWTGALTSLFAALLALGQRDIKRVLAYSTLSQLGYMVLAVGAHAGNEGLFHLATHAFFKALLFLAAGSVIHALHHEQDVWRMGGLWRKLPLTALTFGVGSLALAGVWPFSGFFSKDAIVLSLEGTPWFYLALVTAALTPFYIAKTVCLVFFGQPRVRELHEHAHEGGWLMAVPLVALAIPAVCSGWSGVLLALLGSAEAEHHGLWPMVLTGLPFVSIAAAVAMYGLRRPDARAAATQQPTAVQEGLYIDDIYEQTVVAAQDTVADAIAWTERQGFERGLPSALSGLVRGFAAIPRAVQNGDVNTYLFVFGAGAAVLFAVFLSV